MKEIPTFLYDQITAKLLEPDISIEARNILVEIKQEIQFLNKEPFTLDDTANINKKLERFGETLHNLKEKEDKCLETKD